jgi:hypothetical protein
LIQNPHYVLVKRYTPLVNNTNIQTFKLNIMNKNLSFEAVIELINDEVKTKSNGKSYVTAEVKFTSGALAGKKYFAQRTLGESKAEIKVGQSVRCMVNTVLGDDGVERPFFEISTSRVNDAADIMAALKGA